MAEDSPISETIDSFSDLLKKARKLRKEMEPNATIHQARDKAEMKKAVLDVKDIIDRLPADQATKIQKDFQSVRELVTRVVDKQ